MAYLIVLAGAAVIALLVWRALDSERAKVSGDRGRRAAAAPPVRPKGPDDDVDFLQGIDESLRRGRGDQPPAG